MPDLERDFRITRIEALACRVPVATPVATSFGIMRNRPAVFVRIEDAEGHFGWGEAFANWPAAGAEHRVNLLMEDVADLVLGRDWDRPETMFHTLEAETRIRALQCGEPGPFAQVIAALDIAAWDMVARRAGLPVAQAISPGVASCVPAYASGIHIDAALRVIDEERARGFSRFKVKVGFGPEDAEKLLALCGTMKPGERLFADASQAWSMAEAAAILRDVEAADLGWLEEPMPAYAPEAEWVELARLKVPLAGGENIAGFPAFDSALASGALGYVQPDVAKWGGITGCYEVARRTLASGAVYCPHFLGGGIGLTASAHVLAAAGGEGLLEVDVNPNPLRAAFELTGRALAGGAWEIGSLPGLGITDLPEEVLSSVSLRRERSVAAV